MSSLHKSADGFTVVEGLVIFFVVFIVGFVGFYLFQPRTGPEYHSHVEKAALNTATYTKKLAENVGIPAKAVVNKGVDLGCTIALQTQITFSPKRGADCSYNYYVYYLGSGSPHNDTQALLNKIKATSYWNINGAAPIPSDATFQNNPTTFSTTYPLSYTFKTNVDPVYGPTIQIDLLNGITAYPDGSNYNNAFYASLVKKYLPQNVASSGADNDSKYIFGFSINYQYAAPSCTVFCSYHVYSIPQ